MKIKKKDQEDSSTIKTHDEILELFNDIKLIEHRLNNTCKENADSFENEILKKESEQIFTAIELTNKPQSLKYQSEIKSNIQTEKIEGKKIIFPF